MAASKHTNKLHTLFLPIPQKEYARFMNDKAFARQTLTQISLQQPDLWPKAMQARFVFNGKSRLSKKSSYQLRQIKIGNQFHRLQPSWLLPNQRTTTDVASKALLLARFAVPFCPIAYLFGRNSMFWYRLVVGLGRFNLVSTTLLKAANLPSDASGQADQASLQPAYGVFRAEARQLQADFTPKSVNCDGWKATTW